MTAELLTFKAKPKTELVGVCDLDINEGWIPQSEYAGKSHPVSFYKAPDGSVYEECFFPDEDDVPNGEGWEYHGDGTWARTSQVRDLRALPLSLPHSTRMPNGWFRLSLTTERGPR